MDDYEVKRNLWESKIPVEFILDSDDSLRKRQSTFVMLPRISYFALHLSKIGLALSGLDEKKIDDMWLEYNGKPLKWNYPIGVLFDLYVKELPWTVTIKLKEFPDELVRCQSRKVLRQCFIQSLKEADQLKHKCNVAYALTADESNRLFDSLAEGKFDEFWSVNKKFMVDDEKQALLYIPIRFYEPSAPFRQVLMPPRTSADGDDNPCDFLLRDALLKAFPDQAIAFADRSAYDCELEAVSHGIALPLDAPLLWLARNFSYPDNFVHVVWREKH